MKKNSDEFYGEWIDQEQEKEQRRLDRIGGFFKTVSWIGFILPVVMPTSFLLWFLVAFVWWALWSFIGGKISRDW